MAETVFSKILRGDLPSHKIYEDAHVFAFLDISPLSDGHTLVIPKEPAATLDQLCPARPRAGDFRRSSDYVNSTANPAEP
jgi:diadenosine tetraphosphate (Ap4A) HIT family hydrolase